ncbi:putative Ig domain-containing protein [Amylibacter sp.]|nr:putative Ig domain-containing protein [Amylibacter sp.]
MLSACGTGGVNSAPILKNKIRDQSIAEDSALNFQFNTNVFRDIDVGNTLSYSAALGDGNDFPSWLSFDANTRTFTGTPLNGDVGSIAVKVTATDSSDATVADTFNLTITNTNDAPAINNPIVDQSIAEDSALNFQFNTNVFRDIDVGDTLTYTATLVDGSALPSWLSFDANTRTFTGTPLNGDVGSIAVKVTATDSSDATVADTFNLTITNTNDAPAITSTAITTAMEGSAYSYTFTASDVDANDTLTYSTSALPSWLNLNATTGVLSGTPGETDAGLSSITLTATDAAGLTATQTMKLSITTGSVSIGGSHTGTLGVTGDKDWIAVELTQGQAYGVSLSGNSGSYVGDVIEDPDHDPSILNCGCPSCIGSVKQEVEGSEIEAALIDPYVYVYDKDGNLIKSDDDSGSGRNSYLTFTPTYSGTYYIEARAWNDNYIGDYKIEVSEVIPPRPTDALEWGNAAWNTSQTIDVYFADSGVTVSDGTTSTGFTDAEETSMMGMLSNVTNFANISFQKTEIQAGADIRFAHANLGGGLLGYMYPQNYNSNEGLGVLTNNTSYWNDTSMQVGGFMYGVVVHEIGHGLGLAHPHDTGGGSLVMEGVSYSGDKGDYGQMNQSVYTVMSYNEGFAAHPLGLPSNYGSGYMGSFAALDIAVLQNYYGANTSYNNGSTTYNLGSRDYYEAIWDGGGTDEITMNGSSNAVIDLRAATLDYEVGGAGFVSYNANAKGGFTIANGVVIENAKGSGGTDTIIGNDTNNIIYGGSGAGIKDTLTGNRGIDTFVCIAADASTGASTTDRITDFTDGIDLIGLDNGLSIADLTFSQNGNAAQIVNTSTNTFLFLLDNFTYSNLTDDDFVQIDFV